MSDEDGELPLDPAEPPPPAPDKDAQRSAVDTDGNRKIRNRQKREEAERAAFWRTVFSTEIGRREMWCFIERLHPFNAKLGTSPAGTSDERVTWMHLAEQLVGQEIFQEWWGREPELVMLMRQENDPRHLKGRG